MRNVLNFHALFHKSVIKFGQAPVYRVSAKVFASPFRNESFTLFTVFNLNKLNTKFKWPARHYHTTCAKSVKVSDYSESKKKKNENAVIYYGSLTGRIKGVRVFTCMTSIGGLALQPLIVQNILSGDSLPYNIALWTCIAFFTFVTPLLFHVLARKYVIEIRYNSATDTYTATTLSFFLQRKDISFKIEDVSIPDFLPLFTTMYLKGKPVFIVSESFLELEHYIKMMGYDKPIDLKLYSSNDATDKVDEKQANKLT